MPLSSVPGSFYNRPVVEVARALLGALLVRQMAAKRIAGYIIETEAYAGESDLACHARAGRTPRTEVMYGPPGRAYVYFIYGMHWMLNVVAESEGSPSAILIRALLPSEGIDRMEELRHTGQTRNLTDGPAKLCQALSIDGHLNGVDLTTQAGGLWIEPGVDVRDADVICGPRVGINYAGEPWVSKPWRFRVDARKMGLPAG